MVTVRVPMISSENPSARPREKNSITSHLVDRIDGTEYTKIFHTSSSALDPLHGGTCWCTTQFDDFCTCTPSLAVDVILTSGENHIWLVKRSDTGQYATMGGFVEVGETSAEAVVRELGEETGVSAVTPPRLFGVYDDPRRDAKRYRHSVSVVYVLDIPLDAEPKAGDDVKQVVRVSLDHVDDLDFFIDHKTIVMDYKLSKMKGTELKDRVKYDLVKRKRCSD